MVAAGIAHFVAMVPPAMHTDVGAIAVLASLALYAVPTDLGAIALLANRLSPVVLTNTYATAFLANVRLPSVLADGRGCAATEFARTAYNAVVADALATAVLACVLHAAVLT